MQYIFELYVAGESAMSKNTVRNLRKLTEYFPPETCEISVIDITKDPERAAEKHILATPTLIKTFPAPQQRIIGDLSQMEKVIAVLGLKKPEFIKEVTT
jgi:circadian clock protein KaiB